MSSEFEKAAEALLFTEEISFKTKGRSMEPLFSEHRDIINIKTVRRKLKRGDVILYPSKSGDSLILHRVIKVKGENLLIRGDNNFFDEHRKTDEVVGIMTSFFRKGKYFDVDESFIYKIYSSYIMNSYRLRRAFRFKIMPGLSRIKRSVFGKKPTN